MSVSLGQQSVQEYQDLVAAGVLDDRAVELLQGKIVEMSPAGPLHSNRVWQSANAIRRQLPPGFDISEAHPITLIDSEPEPDIAVVVAKDYDERHPEADEVLLIIEFAQSSLQKDLQEKRSIYAQANIPEYWVVDLTRQVVITLWSTDGDDYQLLQEVGKGPLVTQNPNLFLSLDVSILVGKPRSL